MKAQSVVQFRKAIRHSGAEFEVVRKRLFLKALEETGASITRQSLTGHIGVIFAIEDPLDVIKQAFEFAKSNALALQFLGSRFEGKFLAAAETEMLSKLPSLSQMRAQVLALFMAPATQTVGVFNSLLGAVPQCLDQMVKRDTE